MKDTCIACLEEPAKHQRAKYPIFANMPTDSDHHHNQSDSGKQGLAELPLCVEEMSQNHPASAAESVQPGHVHSEMQCHSSVLYTRFASPQ